MSKEKEKEQELEKKLEQEVNEAEENAEETVSEDNTEENVSQGDALQKELNEAKDKYLRLMAEYDNFRKRTAKERIEISDTVKGNTLEEILPVFDNFERALDAETEDTAYKQGVEMIFKQFGDVLNKLGVEVIDPLGETFDPNIANAVNQIEDSEKGENEVAQVFQEGYKIGEKVIRYAMVVVANP